MRRIQTQQCVWACVYVFASEWQRTNTNAEGFISAIKNVIIYLVNSLTMVVIHLNASPGLTAAIAWGSTRRAPKCHLHSKFWKTGTVKSSGFHPETPAFYIFIVFQSWLHFCPRYFCFHGQFCYFRAFIIFCTFTMGISVYEYNGKKKIKCLDPSVHHLTVTSSRQGSRGGAGANPNVSTEWFNRHESLDVNGLKLIWTVPEQTCEERDGCRWGNYYTIWIIIKEIKVNIYCQR